MAVAVDMAEVELDRGERADLREEVTVEEVAIEEVAIEVSDTEPSPGADAGLEAASFLCSGCQQRPSVLEAFPLGRCACLRCRHCLVKHTESRLAEALAALRAAQSVGSATVETIAARPGRGALLALPLRSLPCPACGLPGGLDRGDVVDLCSGALRALEEAAAEAKLSTLTRCPACGAGVELAANAELPEGLRPTGIPEFDRTLPRGFAQKDAEGRPLSREALVHRERHRFRCTCSKDFCGKCRVTPYHLGYTCEAWEERRRKPDCHFCVDKATSIDALVALAGAGRASSSRERRPRQAEAEAAEDERDPLARLRRVVSKLPLKVLRKELRSMGLTAVSSCIERQDVEQLARSVHVCSSAECRERLSGSCLRVLPCGHFCSGCKGERSCPPCLTCSDGATGGGSCPICAESLPPGPAVRLECGHAVHALCLARRLGVTEKSGWEPPSGPVSFDFRRCPICRARIGDLQWPQDVASALRKASELESEVAARAVKRLKVDQEHRRDEAILPGGAFEGRPRDYALSIYQYHLCEECRKPYFGGERRCQAEAPPGDGAVGREDARQLCGGCAALKAGKACPEGHDPSFVEWKCQRCCSLAVWFCWGTTHFCNRCHDNVNRPPVPCPGPARCPWGGKHPPNGSGEPFCLGCSLCRHRDIA